MIYLLSVAFLILFLGSIYVGLTTSLRRVPIFELYISLAILTLGLAPTLAYLLQQILPPEVVLQPMPIPATTYFTRVIPVLLAIGLGVLPWKKNQDNHDQDLFVAIQTMLRQQAYLPFLLMLYGIMMHYISPFLPPSIRQIGAFSEMVVWIGLLHLLLSNWAWAVKVCAFVLVFTFLILKALQTTMFGDLFVWPVWLMLYLQTRYRWSLKVLALSGGGVVICLVFVLLWKYDYRERLAQPGKNNHGTTLSNTITDWAKNPWNTQRWQQALDRFNQGNHLAQVYRWVPQEEPYAKGETIILAVKASLVPRFLWPDKPLAGGAHIWYRFTGNRLSPNVSMNIGIPGEAYANFGLWLSPLLVLFWVRFLYYLYHQFRQLALKHYPLLWLWIPLLFYPLMDQENDLVTSLNHVTKGTLFIFTFCWILYKVYCFWGQYPHLNLSDKKNK